MMTPEDDMTPDELLNLAENTARAAGDLLLEMQGKIRIDNKELSHDLVTEADVAAQKQIEEALTRGFPKAGFIGEEDDRRAALDQPWVWIVDPIDGTNNFAHQLPQFGVSIALYHRGEPFLGVVFDPSKNELFSAVQGQGALLNGKPIHGSGVERMDLAMVITGFYYDRGAMVDRTLESVKRLFHARIHGIRRLGSAALDLCWMACGRADAYFEEKLSLWDYAAGALIAEEAGVKVGDIEGKDFHPGMRGITAASKELYPHFIELVGLPPLS